MIKTCLLSAAVLTTLSSMALAADLPSRVTPPVYVAPPAAFSWAGFYVGGQIGYAFGEDRGTLVAPAPGASGGAHLDGIMGGGHLGYNFAAPSLGGLILGVEGDVDGTDYHEPGTPNPAFASQTYARNQIQGSARGRLGFAVDRALVYATGGASFAQFQTTYSSPTYYVSNSHTRVGWTVGGGVEYAITTQWSLRAEYRYADYGSFRDPVVTPIAFDRRERMQRAQVGFSYKFDTPVVPVVARY